MKQIVSFGASVFVLPAFAEGELARPRPGLNARILKSVDCGHSVVLTDADRRAGNARGDLTIAVLYGSWGKGLTDDEIREVQLLQTTSFLEIHAGYRFKQLIYETIGPTDRKYAEDIPGWTIVANFEDGYRDATGTAWEPGRALSLMDAQSTQCIPGTAGAILFNPRRPTLGLRPQEQQVLTAALQGFTDDEMAKQHGLSKATIKKRWAAIFTQIGLVRPDLVRASEGKARRKSAESETRGPQKRHRLIAFLRQHPEELRPNPSQPRGEARKRLTAR